MREDRTAGLLRLAGRSGFPAPASMRSGFHAPARAGFHVAHGGEGVATGWLACLYVLTDGPQKKMELMGSGLALVPYHMVALPLVGHALWLFPCIYSYEVEAV